MDRSPALQPPVLTARRLSVTFGSGSRAVHAVREIDLDVRRGEFVALLGESGSGKSATARALMGLDEGLATITADRLTLGDTDLLAARPEELRRLRGARMSLILQDALSSLNPVLTIGDQIGEVLRVHTLCSRRQAAARAEELLRLVGIPDPARRLKDYPHQFSGGMRQRILIAMGIAMDPELLIADEPTTALDVTVQAQILELLDRLRRELGMAVLLITHDLGVVAEVADHVVVMYAGRVVENAPADDVFSRPTHPYTMALLESVPQASLRGGRLPAIPGSPPSPAQTPPGCSFNPRCPYAVDLCRTERPLLRTTVPGVLAACHRSEEILHDRVA